MKRDFYHGEAVASVVVVNPMVSLISRPTAIRFTPALLRSPSIGRAVLSPSDLFFHNFHPFVRRGGDGDGGANGTDRKIPAVSEEKQSREDFAVSSPETGRVARRMIYLCFLSRAPRDRDRNRILRIEFCEWNPIARRRLEFAGTDVRAKGNSEKYR